MNGYFADISGSDGESSQEVRNQETKQWSNDRSTTIEGKEKSSSKPRKHSRKLRTPGSLFPNETVESPIHPDINYRLTKHVFSKDFPDDANMISANAKKSSDVLRTKTMSSETKPLPLLEASATTGILESIVGQETPISSEVQQTSTIIPCERRSTSFSKRHRRLEEGLALTQIPRYVNHSVVRSISSLQF
jgi:hypothetical protein